MPNNWIELSVEDVKSIPSSSIIDYQIVYIKEWGDFAFYHPTYVPKYNTYDSLRINGIVYNLYDYFCLRPLDRTNDTNPGRWLKMGDITLNISSLVKRKIDDNFLFNLPEFIPYRIGQRFNIIIRNYITPDGYENPDVALQDYPNDFMMTWEAIKLLSDTSQVQVYETLDTYGLTWWLTYIKPIISFVNPEENSIQNIPGLFWYKSDENRMFLSDGIQWSEITFTEGVI